MIVTITENPNKSFTVDFDVEARTLYDRVVSEKSGGLSSQALLDQLITNWMRHHDTNFDNEDFQKLTPTQKKKGIEEGKKVS